MNNVVQNYLKQYASIQHDRRYNKKLLSNILNKEKPEIAGAFLPLSSANTCMTN